MASLIRQQLAEEAARIMATEQVIDFAVAKRKAAERIGVSSQSRDLPSNPEIQAALLRYQQLFTPSLADDVATQRQMALDGLAFFQQFRPLLTGNLIEGLAVETIVLHLFTDCHEEVMIYLLDQQVPFEETNKRYRLGTNEYREYPAYSFEVDEQSFVAAVFAERERHHPPLCRVHGTPMQRLSLTQLQKITR